MEREKGQGLYRKFVARYEGTRKNVFLALIGASAFELLVSLVTPDDVAGKS